MCNWGNSIETVFMGDEYYNEEFRLLVEHDIEQFQKQLCNANAKDKR